MERLSMRKIKEVLRLKQEQKLTNRAIARSCSIGRATVGEYLRRAVAAGLNWPLPEEVDEAELERRLFPPPPDIPVLLRPVPVWSEVHQELRRKGLTLFLLWEEYRQANPDGFQYSWFCEHYNLWAGKLDLVMRQQHRAGEKTFVDYAGQTVPVVNPETGEVREAQIFLAVLGASSYTYAEATWTQQLPDWIGSHVRAFAFFGGVTEILVPDNLKSGVSKACRYDPDINPTYQDLASHYGCAVIPARKYRAKDKAKAEAGVLLVERWILARLRKTTFFSLSQLNRAIRELLDWLNAHPFQKLPGSRRSQFETLDKPALRPLPARSYVYADWKKARVHIDYHVEVDGHHYSVPYQLFRREVEIRYTQRIVEAFFRGLRVASHVRSYRKGGFTTLPEHMPKAHQQYLSWTPQRLIRWAAETGPLTARMIEAVLSGRTHPQQGFRNCLGILRLGKAYGADRLENACRRALTLGSHGYRSIESILKNGLDRKPLPTALPTAPVVEHDNLRGPRYYQ
jgi:transposase